MTTTETQLAKTYQKKSDIEHILDAPDTYIGSIENEEVYNWTFDEESSKITHKKYNWVPGLYKCFDEGIVNARDHYIRMEEKWKTDKSTKRVSYINIDVNKETGVITIITHRHTPELTSP